MAGPDPAGVPATAWKSVIPPRETPSAGTARSLAPRHAGSPSFGTHTGAVTVTVLASRPTSPRAPAPSAPLRWRVLCTPPRDGAANMALDEALLHRAAATGEGTLRVYAWSRPTLSLGRHQSARGRYDLARAAALGIAFVRRPTGGRAVLHHREVTYSIAAPAGPAGSLGTLAESYAWINRLLVEGLRALGADVQVAAPAGRPPRPGIAPCFETPVEGELCAGGGKLVGSAQVRLHGALLQHGSILVDDDQPLAAELLREPGPPPPPAATLRSLLGVAPTQRDVADALAGALGPAEALTLDGALREHADALRTRYDDPAWTWRR